MLRLLLLLSFVFCEKKPGGVTEQPEGWHLERVSEAAWPGS